MWKILEDLTGRKILHTPSGLRIILSDKECEELRTVPTEEMFDAALYRIVGNAVKNKNLI